MERLCHPWSPPYPPTIGLPWRRWGGTCSAGRGRAWATVVHFILGTEGFMRILGQDLEKEKGRRCQVKWGQGTVEGNQGS